MMVNIEAKDFPVDGLEATGEVVKVHVPRGAEWRSYNLFGDQDGSIIVDGAWCKGEVATLEDEDE
jgi:hypothetical protein